MALVWQCDRCTRISNGGNVDDPPDNWRQFDAPVRGSEGARSTRVVTICGECDDLLYDWLAGPRKA